MPSEALHTVGLDPETVNTGTGSMTTEVVTVDDAHPPTSGIVYVTVYVPVVLVDGSIEPVLEFNESPTDEEKVPPKYRFVPVNETDCEVSELQNGSR
jgi:hypothetical protein